MPVSPADFYAYSQATGVPVPEDPQQRAQLAPSVMEFRRNQLKQAQEPSIDPLSAGVGIGLALAGAGAAGLAGRRLLRSGKSTGQSGVQLTNVKDVRRIGDEKPTRKDVYRQVATKPESELPPVTKPVSGVDVELITDPYTGEKFAPGKSPYTETDRAQTLVNEYVQSLADREIAREEKVKREVNLMKEGAAMRILDELRQEPTLVNNQKQQAPLVSDQQFNAVETGEDQMTGRMRQQLQRDKDINLMEVDALEDINTQNINAMMEMGDPSQVMGYEVDAPINQAAAQATGGIPFDQAEGFIGPKTAQETLELATQDMLQRRQALVEQGLIPGTTKYEKALAQSFRTTVNVEPQMTGSTMQKTTLPAGPIRQTVQEVSASQYLPEFSVENIGPEAKVTKTALGTAIRGASPVLEQQPSVIRERQVFGTADVNVPGAPDEMMPDRPARETALSQIETQPQMRQDPYAVAQEEGGGSAGIGVYGIEPSYVPGAQSKATGQYSAASSRRPTDMPFKEKQQGFQALNTEQLSNFIANAPEGLVKQAGLREQQRRANVQKSLIASEAIRRANIEGRDSQSVLRSFGFGV